MISKELEGAYVIHSIMHTSIWRKYTYTAKIITSAIYLAKTFDDICLTLESFNLGWSYQSQTSFNYRDSFVIDRIRGILEEFTQILRDNT